MIDPVEEMKAKLQMMLEIERKLAYNKGRIETIDHVEEMKAKLQKMLEIERKLAYNTGYIDGLNAATEIMEGKRTAEEKAIE